MIDAIDALKFEISSHGMTPPDHIEPGKINRFSDNGNGNKNGWCILNINHDGTAGAVFGNWKDIKKKWFYVPDGQHISAKQQNYLNKQIDEAQEKAKNDRRKKQHEAAKKANEIWEKAQAANPNHNYLVKKQIEPYGLKQFGKALLIPVLDKQGSLCSLQEIFPDGYKKFLPGGKIKGGSFVIGKIQDTFYICEGFATGASIHKASGKPVILAFNSGNLKKIAQIYKEKHPDKTIVIAADNDINTEKKTGVNSGKKAAEDAAKAIGADLCICPINSDFNDLQVKQSINAVQQALKKTRKLKIESSAPLPLERDMEKAESYPLEALGEILGGAADIMNKGIQAPDGLCAHAVLGFATHAVQGHANGIIDGRIIPLNEFYLSIGSRSSRKSECDKSAGYVHKEVQRELLNQYKINREAFKDEHDAYKKEREQILNNNKKSLSEKNEAFAKLRKNSPIPPYEPLIVFNDPTVEGIHGLFLNGTPSKYLCADEGGQVSGGYSMASEKKTYTATIYSKYWDGAPIDRVRGGDGSSVLYGRRLSMHLMMQEKIAAEFFNDEIMRNQGLISRFLISYPESLAGSRRYQPYNTVDTPEMIRFYKQVKKILDIPLPFQEDNEQELEPRTIPLEKPAKTAWISAYEGIESESGKGHMFEPIEGFAGKASNHIIRLAGIMALFDDIHRKSIPKQYIDNAVVLMEYYLNERLRLTKMAEPNYELEQAQSLLKWIQKKKLTKVTLPDVYQLGPSRFRNKKQAQASINILLNHNWLSLQESGGKSQLTNKKSNDIWSVTHGKI